MKTETTDRKLGRFFMETTENEMPKQESYFYVLWCKDNSFYAGYTTDLNRREQEHNEGIGAKYTRVKHRRPLKMIYAETFETKSYAMRAEAAFKKLKRPQKEKYLQENDVVFPLSRKRDCVIKERGKFL